MKIRSLGIVANIHKRGIGSVVGRVASAIPESIRLVGNSETAALLTNGRIEKVGSFSGSDAVIALGGDGTFLRAARFVERDAVPILGIKVGSLGFLSEDDPEEAVSDLLAGRCAVQERMRLEISFSPAGEPIYTALNDAVVHGAGVSRVLHLATFVDGALLGEYYADGVIVSTPTGSTAYSLAAGGPIVNPVTMNSIILTPLSPHPLSLRPVVIGADENVTIELVAGGQETLITIDGQQVCSLPVGHKVNLRRSVYVTRLVVNEKYNFYDLVRRKLQWGGKLPKG